LLSPRFVFVTDTAFFTMTKHITFTLRSLFYAGRGRRWAVFHYHVETASATTFALRTFLDARVFLIDDVALFAWFLLRITFGRALFTNIYIFLLFGAVNCTARILVAALLKSLTIDFITGRTSAAERDRLGPGYKAGWAFAAFWFFRYHARIWPSSNVAQFPVDKASVFVLWAAILFIVTNRIWVASITQATILPLSVFAYTDVIKIATFFRHF